MYKLYFITIFEHFESFLLKHYIDVIAYALDL